MMIPPYETAEARRNVLYRIPPLPEGGRVIELHFRGTAPILSGDWPRARVTTLAIAEWSVETAGVGTWPSPPGCDMIVLHRTLDDAGAQSGQKGEAAAAAETLRYAIGMLRSGGVIAGCFANRHAVSVRGRFLPRSPVGTDEDISGARRGVFSAASFRRSAIASGLSDLTIYCLYPGPGSPMLLLDMSPHVFRHFVRRDLGGRKRSMSDVRYFAKRLWVALALGRFVCPSYFYFGFKR